MGKRIDADFGYDNFVKIDKNSLFTGDTFKRTLCDMFDVSYYTDNDKLLDLVKENL